MAVWTVFEPDEASDGLNVRQWADKVVFVRERLSWSALPFAPLVLLRHRLWLAFVVYCVFQALVAFGTMYFELDYAWPLFLIAHLVVALELPDLRRRKLSFSGYDETAAVVASTLEGAEQRYFDARLAGATRQPAASWSEPLGTPARENAPRATTAGPVLGLFPEAGR